MDELCVGAVVDRPPGPNYPESLTYAEVAPRHPLPRVGTLGRWRETAPRRLQLGLVAPRLGPSSSTPAVTSDADLFCWVSEAATALDAVAVVVPTGTEITPGHRDRERLERCFEALPRDRLLVWAPGGLWEADDAVRLARAIGVVAAFDPLAEAPHGPTIYARILGRGGRHRLSDGMLAEVAQRVRAVVPSRAFVTIESQRSVRDATKLQALFDSE